MAKCKPLHDADNRPPDAAEILEAGEPVEAAERPRDADAPEFRREPAAMRALVEATLRRLNLPAQDLWRDEVADAWERVAPPEIAKLLRPGKWEQGVLYFYVPNSVRLFEIQRQHLRAIEAGLRQRLGAARLRQVRLMIDPDAAASTGRPIG